MSPLAAAERQPPVFLAGATAVGKSAIAMALAEKVGGEIISVDSMQVYRGLDIGTAKPSVAARTLVPHHLIDVVELTEPFDAAKFVRLAKQAAVEIQSRHRVPILCGGTGLYFKAYLEGLGDAPAANEQLRAELESARISDLLAELERCDPETFAKIDRSNPRRVIRAIEVIRLTGKPFSEQRARWGEATDEPNLSNSGSQGRSPHPVFCLSRASIDLHRRINARVDEMFAAGLVEETRGLLERGLEQNKTALQAIGYRQVVEHLHGERSLSETIELVKIKTRQFAKRQLTWFRKHARAQWIELQPTMTAAEISDRLLERGGA